MADIIPTISRPRQERLRKVQDLFDSGMKPKEIAEYVGKCERQIYRDLADVKALNRALILEVDHYDILGREFRFLQELRRKAMRDYMLCREGDNAKVGYLRTALTAHEKLVKMLQDVGLIKKVPERVAVETAIPFEDPDVRKAYLGLPEISQGEG